MRRLDPGTAFPFFSTSGAELARLRLVPLQTTSYGAIMTLEMGEAWTDERLDDLNARVDQGLRVDERFDRLERSVDRRFDKVDERFDRLEGSVDKRFDKVDERFDRLEDSVDKRFDKVDERFEKVEERFDEVDKRFEKVDERFERIDEKFERMLVHMDKKFDAVNDRLLMMSWSIVGAFAVLIAGLFGFLATQL